MSRAQYCCLCAYVVFGWCLERIVFNFGGSQSLCILVFIEKYNTAARSQRNVLKKGTRVTLYKSISAVCIHDFEAKFYDEKLTFLH